MTKTEKRIETLKLLQKLKQGDEKPGDTILRALCDAAEISEEVMTNRAVVERIIADWSNPQFLRLHAGELTAQEVRTVRAVLKAVGHQIIESLPAGYGETTDSK